MVFNQDGESFLVKCDMVYYLMYLSSTYLLSYLCSCLFLTHPPTYYLPIFVSY
jgi:hypothetical protein